MPGLKGVRGPLKSDTVALQNFICTEPSSALYDPHRGKHHPRQWELEVQSGIRRLKFPPHCGEVVRIAEAETGDLAGICIATPSENEHISIIQAIAVAVPYRRQGVGRLLLASMLTELSTAAILARIHHRNDSSIRLFDEFGFEPAGHDKEEPALLNHLLLRD